MKNENESEIVLTTNKVICNTMFVIITLIFSLVSLVISSLVYTYVLDMPNHINIIMSTNDRNTFSNANYVGDAMLSGKIEFTRLKTAYKFLYILPVDEEIESIAIYGPITGGYGKSLTARRVLTLCQSGDKEFDCKKMSEESCIRNDLMLNCGLLEGILNDSNKKYDYIINNNYEYRVLVDNILENPMQYYLGMKTTASSGNLLIKFL